MRTVVSPLIFCALAACATAAASSPAGLAIVPESPHGGRLAPGERARFVVVNTSASRDLSGARVRVDGGPGWRLASTTCAEDMPARSRCEAVVAWEPDQEGPGSARLMASSTLPASSSAVPLQGSSGSSAGLLLAGDAALSQPLAPGSRAKVRVLNPRSSSTLSGLRARLDGGPGWRLESSSCPRSLAPGASCEALLSWNPPPSGAFSQARFEVSSQTPPVKASLGVRGLPQR